jgi:phosphoenolpyruvate---glycerone phosphotransferase subunit DhaK
MQKIINDPARFAEEMLDGILLAHPSELRQRHPGTIIRADAPVQGKVAIVTGGGSGHLPVFLGYVGPGLADGAAIGNVFASPSAEQIHAVTRDVDGGAGVLYLFGNYGGDVMNFALASELAKIDEIPTATLLAADDVASAPRGERSRRRGIAGIAFLYKIAGAAAERGASLPEVLTVATRAADHLHTFGVALGSCTLPAAGHPTFELPPGEMELGMGIHGEPGVRRGALLSADEIGDEIVSALLSDAALGADSRVDVLVNGLGATPAEELYILYRRCHQILEREGISVRRAWVGEYATSLEMAGASISLLEVDDELAELLDAPADSPFLVRR